MSLEEIELKRERIGLKLNEIFQSKNKFELLAIDMELSVFVSSAITYKHETVLKPFPSSFSNSSNSYNINYNRLVNTLLRIPPVLKWLKLLNSLDDEQILLINWFLFEKNFKLALNTNINQEKLKQDAKFETDFIKPKYVFEVIYDNEKNAKFETIRKKTAELLESNYSPDPVSSLNFHGTRMDNIYSILSSGLLTHFSKNALFGEGTYLSQEPSISLHYSTSNKTWNHSIIGQNMSCLLCCETINDPQYVKIGINERESNKKNTNNNIPDKYFIVKNNDYVRVRYLLVYADKIIYKPSKFNQLFSENKFLIILICYSLLLIFVGLLNSKVFHKYFRYLR